MANTNACLVSPLTRTVTSTARSQGFVTTTSWSPPVTAGKKYLPFLSVNTGGIDKSTTRTIAPTTGCVSESLTVPDRVPLSPT